MQHSDNCTLFAIADGCLPFALPLLYFRGDLYFAFLKLKHMSMFGFGKVSQPLKAVLSYCSKISARHVLNV